MLYKYTENNSIATLTLNNVKGFNTLTLEFLNQLIDQLDKIKNNSKLKVLVIEGNEKVFSAGHDLKEIQSQSKEEVAHLFEQCGIFMEKIRLLPMIVIAKVEGVAVAAGCQLVAACDLAVATTKARFGVPGINSGLFCSTPAVFLSRNIGRKKALELLVRGNLISAQEALDHHLLNAMVGPDDIDDYIKEITNDIAKQSAEILALGKKMFYKQLQSPDFEALDLACQIITDNSKHPDALEGIDAFINKRKPNWD